MNSITFLVKSVGMASAPGTQSEGRASPVRSELLKACTRRRVSGRLLGMVERVRCSYLGMSVLWVAMNRTAPLQSTMKVALAGTPASLGKVEGRAWHLATPRLMESTRSWSERRGNPRAPPKLLLIHLLMARGLSAITPTTWPRERRGISLQYSEGLRKQCG